MSNPSSPAAGIGLLLCDDMMFTSRITGTARDLGLTVKPARSQEVLKSLLSTEPSCIIVDLANPGLNVANLISDLRATCQRMPRVIAYGSHVDTDTLRGARDAGCDLVLPRSKFVEQLPHSLPAWLQAPGEPGR